MTHPLSVLLLLMALGSFIACTSSEAPPPPLPEGMWTGALTPMNHPEMKSPVRYDVRRSGGTLAIALIGPNDDRVAVRAIRHTADSLHFAFDEPEEGAALQCALSRQSAGTFAGRCADAAGKWARFTMAPPPH